ncbi:MAG: four helix bundle protein [Muribaculaceae bacterium]|nr:four helix bundle protein [Muribaculaceae bacterium]MDE6320732.1 four helix bundle protein [Muribaculaceae bacterium]
MKRENVVRDKSYAFARRCVRLYKYLCDEKKEYVLSKQLLRSGTSIGANIAESQYGQSKLDFASKLSIAQKEAGETEFWIRLLGDEDYITKEQSESLLIDCRELIRLLQSITKTLYNK